LNQNKQQPTQSRVRRHFLLALVPHQSNDYQPHLIRRYGLLAVLFLVVGIQVFYNLSQTGSVLGEKANVTMEALLNETNNARQEQNLADLNLNERLNEAAALKAKDMFDRQYWGHNAPDGTEPWHWLIEADYGYTKAGENLAKNFYTAEAVTAAWMNSTDHRKNILDPEYTEVGFAVLSGELKGEATTIVVALYGRPVGTGVVSPGTLVAGAEGSSLTLLSRIGVGMQSMTPAALGSIFLLTLVMIVAFVAHLYRDYIPVSSSHPRHRHNHGAIKMSLMFALMLAMIVLYGGGQL
jgi:hypothetical protein